MKCCLSNSVTQLKKKKIWCNRIVFHCARDIPGRIYKVVISLRAHSAVPRVSISDARAMISDYSIAILVTMQLSSAVCVSRQHDTTRARTSPLSSSDIDCCSGAIGTVQYANDDAVSITALNVRSHLRSVAWRFSSWTYTSLCTPLAFRHAR